MTMSVRVNRRSRGKVHEPEILHLLRVIGDNFDVSAWFDVKRKREFSEDHLDRLLLGAGRDVNSGIGFSLTVGSSPSYSPKGFGVWLTVGGDSTMPGNSDDRIVIDLPEALRSVPARYGKVRQVLVDCSRVFEADSADFFDSDNATRMNVRALASLSSPRPSGVRHPVLITALTYLSAELVTAFGGLEAVIDGPFHEVSVLPGGGVLLDLLGTFYDDSDETHRQAQIEAMRFMWLPVSAET